MTDLLCDIIVISLCNQTVKSRFRYPDSELGSGPARRLARLLDGQHGLGDRGAFALRHDPGLEDVDVVPIVRVPHQVGVGSGLGERGERLPVARLQLEVRFEEHGASLSTGPWILEPPYRAPPIPCPEFFGERASWLP